MRRLLLVLVSAGLVFPACQGKPPEPRLERSPSSGQVVAGETVELRATTPLTHQREKFTYQWSASGACVGPLRGADSWKVSYEVPADCPGGTLTFALQSRTRLGTTSHTASFVIEARPALVEEEVGLHPVRPDPLPANWEMLDDFDRPLPDEPGDRRNNRGAFIGTWTYRDGKCELASVESAGSRVVQISYRLPHRSSTINSSCGFFEYFQGTAGEAQQADLTGYESFGFIARMDGEGEARIRVELVEFDQYAPYKQGIVSESETIVVNGEWRRHELPLKQLARTWNLAKTKSIGIRIDARDGNGSTGALLLDNLVLLRPGP